VPRNRQRVPRKGVKKSSTFKFLHFPLGSSGDSDRMFLVARHDHFESVELVQVDQ